VVILGGGPIGLAACAILQCHGAALVILSEPSESRPELARKVGAYHLINPLKESIAERVLALTNGMGAKLFLEATGLPTEVFPDIEQVIWEGRTLNSIIVVVARADAKIPVNGEVLQVRRAQIVGSQGHSGTGNFPRVIQAMASGMNMLPVVTKTISLEEVPENIIDRQTDKTHCKVACLME